MKMPDLRRHLGPVLALLGSLLVINIAVLILVNRPRLAEARSADTTTAALAARVQRAQVRVADLESKVVDLERSRLALQEFFDEDLSTKRDRLVAIQREIHRISSAFQVQASQLKFTHDRLSDNNLVRFAVDIPLSGGYNNLRQFIHHVETSNLFLIIESVQLQNGEQGGVLLNLSVRLATYFMDKEGSELRYRVEG